MEINNYIQKHEFKTAKLFQMDCLELMKNIPDKWFELAICDPPYGINADNNAFKNGINCKNNGFKAHKNNNWDNKIPTKEYFNELFRVSKNQIICGANYFTKYLTASMGWVFWYKMQDNFSFSDGEFIFTSFQTKARIFKYARGNESGFAPKGNAAPNIVPTQKPIALYKWLLKNYAKPNDRIIDTHGGSMSSVIAAIDYGFDITCSELDNDYYNAAIKRIQNFVNQTKIEFNA